MWHDQFMTSDERLTPVREAVRRLRRAEKALDGARAALGQAIADALNAGVRPVNVEPEVPYKREHIRRIARDHGVAPLREPTVVSKKAAGEDLSD
jgi:hypothetical protein